MHVVSFISHTLDLLSLIAAVSAASSKPGSIQDHGLRARVCALCSRMPTATGSYVSVCVGVARPHIMFRFKVVRPVDGKSDAQRRGKEGKEGKEKEKHDGR